MQTSVKTLKIFVKDTIKVGSVIKRVKKALRRFIRKVKKVFVRLIVPRNSMPRAPNKEATKSALSLALRIVFVGTLTI